MAGIVTTGSFPKALWPGINKWFQTEYDSHAVEYTDAFDVETSDKDYEEDAALSELGLASVKPEGTAIEYDDMQQSFVARYVNRVFAKGVMVTEEMVEDDQYGLIQRRTRALARSMRLTKEVVHANVLNRAFNSAYTMGSASDGKELLATDHPLGPYGGTWSNELATPADLSEAALESLIIQIGQAVDARGLQIMLKAQKIIVPVDLEFTVQKILDTELKVDSDQNTVNVIHSGNYLPGGHAVNHYLTDPDAWFVKTNCPDGLKSFQRREMRFAQDNDFNTSNLMAKADERYIEGWSDPRGLYGSAGAA